MTAVTELELPALDYQDPELSGERFHETMERLRERGWLAEVRPLGYVALDREAVAFFMRTKSATFPGTQILELLGVTEGPIHERLQGNLLDLEGEDHRRLRKLVQPAFTPQAADRHRPAMRDFLAELYEPLAETGRCDAVEALAKPYPSLMIAQLMGAPLADAPRLHAWANWIQSQFDPITLARAREQIERASVEFVDYVRDLMATRRKSPGEDLITELLHAEEEGDRLSEEECVSLVSAVLVGGVDTTQSQLAHGMRLFAEHPEQWALLAEDPSLVGAAVEEVLRYEPITPFTARIVTEDLEYRDVSFPKGTFVFASAVTANRDPENYAEPERFDITAERDREKPLTFGAGPHFCLGATLARAELQEAFAYLAPRMRDLALDGEPVYGTATGVYGMQELPVRFTAA